MNVRKLWKLLKDAFGAWSEDYAPSMGAALSYYTLFSIAPLLLIVIAVAGLALGEEAARGAIMTQLQGLMGEEGARAIENMVQSADKPKQGMVATVLGAVTLLIGATTVFGELQSALDRIWRAPAREQAGGLWFMLRTRLLSFGMILGIAFLLLVSLVVSAAVSLLGEMWTPFFGAWEVVAHALNIVIGFGITTVLFAMIYKIMPRVDVSWHDVWIGAGFTALLFTIGRFLIGLYLGKSGVTSSFGAAGSLVLVMVWVYYSAQIFLLGAEFTWVYAHEYGSRRGQARPRAGDVASAKPTGKAGAGSADAAAPRAPELRPAPGAALVTARSGASVSAAPQRAIGAEARHRLRERPMIAMAVAASAGMAMALLTRLRGRRRAAHA